MITETIIKSLLKWNFWGKELNLGIIRGNYVNETLKLLNTKKVITITGIRRAGKSFIAMQAVNSFIKDKKNSLIINFEEARFDEELNKAFLIKIYDSYLSVIKPDKKPIIVLDEAQEVDEWEKFVRSLNDKDEAFLIITGSSAKIMSEELATLLTGRTLTLEVFPLSFKEFLDFKGCNLNKIDLIKNELQIQELFKEYSLFGGFPEVVLEKDKEMKLKILSSYFNDIINKDIIKKYHVRRIDKLDRISTYYLTNFSSLITFNNLSKFLKFNEKSVEIYSKYLETSKLFFFLRRFSSSIKEQENSPRKVYLIDVGLTKISDVLFSDNVSKIYENLVAIHLLRNYKNKVSYWKNIQQEEVDFVIKEGLKITQLIQVCYDISNPNTKEREIRALLKASRELKCKNLFVITDDYEGEEKIKDETIKFFPLWKWLLG